MNTLRRILVIVDPTVDRSAAAVKARTLAETFRAHVTLVACLPEPPAPRAPFVDQERLTHDVREALREPADRRLGGLADELLAAGLQVETRVVFGAPLHEAMLRAIGESMPDLVVKDTHHHAVLRRTLLANTDWHLIRDCPVPLLLVKPRAWPESPRIAVAVDPGHPRDEPAELDHALIDTAERLSRGLGTPPVLVHCWSPAAEFASAAAGATLGGVALPIPQEVVDASSALDRVRLDHLARTHDVPPAQVRRVDGYAIDELPLFAERESIDVFALGAVSRSALQRAFVGSTAERLLESLPCDLLVLKVSPTHPRGERT
jgi:universal stress protein E